MTNQNFRVKNGLEVGNIRLDSGSGIITATKFVGDGSGLTNLPSSGGAASDFVRTSAGIHTLGNVGIGTTVITSALTINKPAIGDTSNYIVAYGTFDSAFWGGIGSFSTYQFDFATDFSDSTYVAGAFQESIRRAEDYALGFVPRKPFIAKFDSSGNVNWQVSFNTSNQEYIKYSAACGICSAASNSIIVALESYDATKTVGVTTSYDGDSTLSFVKFNSSGVIQWQTTAENISLPNVWGFGGSFYSDALKVYLDTDSSDNTYATGRNKGPSEFPLTGSTSELNDFSNSSFIIKLNSSGSIVWQKTINPTSRVSFGSTVFQPVIPKEIFVRNNNIYWFGLIYPNNNSSTVAARVIKFDLDGNLVWDKRFTYGGTTNNQTLFDGKFYVDNSENIYFASDANITTGYDNFAYGYLVEKYDSSMDTKLWSRRINSNLNSTNGQFITFLGVVESLGVDEANGDVYLVGLNENRGSKYPTGYEIYKLNSSGNFIWKRFLSGIGVYSSPSSSSRIKINSSKIKFSTTINTPYIAKEIPIVRPYNPNLDWVEPYHTFTYSSLVTNLNKDGNCIGEYGPFMVEELFYDRNTFTGAFIQPVAGIVSTRPGILTAISNTGVSTIGISTLTFGNIGITTSQIETSLIGSGARVPKTLSQKGNEPYSLDIFGTVKANKLIVGDLEFGYGPHSKGTIAIGYSAGWFDSQFGNPVGDPQSQYNTFIGAYTSPQKYAQVSCSNFIGYRAGSYVSGSYNSNIVGSFAGYYMSGGNYNNFFGGYAGYLTGYGQCNTGFGNKAGMLSMQSYNDIYIGHSAGAFGGSYGGFSNIFFGSYAGSCANGANWGADYNIFIGAYAGCCIGNGSCNIFIGTYAGKVNSSGFGNQFIGSGSGTVNQTGSYNQFYGNYSGACNLTGNTNAFFGRYSASYNVSGSCNNGFGYNAGSCNISGNYNNFFGNYTGIHTDKSYRVIFGQGTSFSFGLDSPKNADKQFVVGINTTGTAEYWLVGDENLNVGIGTTNPTSALTVTGNTLITGVTTITGNLNAAGNSYIKLARTSNQTITNGADTLIGFSVVSDSNNWYSGITTRTTPTVAGTYRVDVMLNWQAGSVTDNQTNIQLRKNGTTFALHQVGIATFSYSQTACGIVTMNGTSDYIDFTVFTGNPTSQVVTGTSDGAWTKMEIFKIN